MDMDIQTYVPELPANAIPELPANGFPKRKVYKGLYWSFHSPINGKLDETQPDWILQRRLSCAVMVQLRAAVLSR